MDSYDVVIVGSGTAGQTAAYDLREAGLEVAVAEKSDRLGGTCALSGCQSKKWFYEAAEAVAKGRALAGRGIEHAPGLLSMPGCAPPTRGYSPSVTVRSRFSWPA